MNEIKCEVEDEGMRLFGETTRPNICLHVYMSDVSDLNGKAI